ncbi:telomerase RNA component interacting RNase [Acipenser ruthenus]|uniref:telomerase RNA component interacting RNase n=1 Tax=Acipenser ruthenus TaxID=7906 RepID=UPI002742354E|nr:telomerase RNA component interacting RNase [Acipenser ruthenus]
MDRTSRRSSESSSSPAAARGIPPAANVFANDGSFMELFKKKMEAEKRQKERGEEKDEEEEEEEEERGQAVKRATGEEPAQPPPKTGGRVTSIVGKRRGGTKLALKTGMVAKKKKLESEVDADKGDAWHMYMAEVKKYKAHQCGDDDKTRPLVK